MIRAIFFDIDGTLVSFQTHQVPESAANAIRKLRAKGIKVFIATGRHLSAINNLGNLEFDGYVTLNGGYCYAGKETVVYKRPIPESDIRKLVEYMNKPSQSFPCIFVGEDGMFMNYENEISRRLFQMLNFPRPALMPVEAALDTSVYQLIAFFHPGQQSDVMEHVIPHCEATSWHPSFADVVPQGSSKSIGIDRILDHFGISLEETMAFGDGGNDISMLRHAAIGIAMGNAAEDVKESADFVTACIDDDGVAKALAHFGLTD